MASKFTDTSELSVESVFPTQQEVFALHEEVKRQYAELVAAWKKLQQTMSAAFIGEASRIDVEVTSAAYLAAHAAHLRSMHAFTHSLEVFLASLPLRRP